MSNETFIGGPWDGRVVPIEDGRKEIWAWAYVELPVDACAVRLGAAMRDAAEIEKVRYKRMDFTGSQERFSLFAEHSLTADDVLRKLIAGYR